MADHERVGVVEPVVGPSQPQPAADVAMTRVTGVVPWKPLVTGVVTLAPDASPSAEVDFAFLDAVGNSKSGWMITLLVGGKSA